MSIILKNSSFGLIRTNPALTTNVKIVSDGDKVYLESIDADPILSDSKYKKFEVSGGLYNTDLFNFYSQNENLIPKDIAYKIYERDDYKSIKDSYSKQYDFTYCSGVEYKNSRLYKQEYSMFSPLWVEPSNIPDYFIIFKIKGPLSLSTDFGLDQNNSIQLDNEIKNPSNFFNNYIKNSIIVKSFDLTKRTVVGQYIRNYVENKLFPKYSILASIKKGDLSYWQGISYENGGFCKKAKSIYNDYTIVDKTIIEKDNYITNGFYENGVVLSNILNMEFLFDDLTSNDYEFNRYFGLYVSESELGSFGIDISSTKFYSNFSSDQKQVNEYISNKNGVVLGVNVSNGSIVDFDSTSSRIPYVKNAKNNFYSVNQTTNWNDIEGSYLRLKNTDISLNDFYDYGVPFKYIDVKYTNKTTPSNFSFKILDNPNVGDQIRIKNISYNEDITKYYTVTGSNIDAGTSNGLEFSVNGSKSDVAKSISSAINFIEIITNKTQQFKSVNVSNRVVVYTRTNNSFLNNIKYTIFSSKKTFPFTKPNEFVELQYVNDYVYYPTTNDLLSGILFSYHFTGGVNKPLGKFTIKQDELYEIYDKTDAVFIKNFVKTDVGFKEITDYATYLEKPIKNTKGEIIGFENIDDYFTCYINDAEISINESNKLSLYHIQKNSVGYLSIFPIRDFDFDFYSTEYSKVADSNIENLKNWYNSSDSYLYGVSGANSILEHWYESEFVRNGGFKTLVGELGDFGSEISKIDCEYDRLKENYLSELALESRIVPYINKWVYDNEAVDVRENKYRLNVNQSFDYSNFSPSFSKIDKDPKLYTHEWYYLQKYPAYFNFDDKLKSFSYFEEDINSNNLYDINNDYFLSYFTRESINNTSIPRSFRYSIFEHSSDLEYPETMFRGVKILVKDRFENSKLDNNIKSKKLLINSNYNDYKFSAILTYGDIGSKIEVIKNDKFKNITLLVKAAIDNPLLYNFDKSYKFIDRCHLYTLKDNYEIEDNEIKNIDKNLSGVISSWEFGSTSGFIKVNLSIDSIGRMPNLLSEMGFNPNGTYNDIILKDFSNITGDGYLKYLKFKDIVNIELNSFDCKSIEFSTDVNGDNYKILNNSLAEILNISKLDYDGSGVLNDKYPQSFLYTSEHVIVKERLKRFLLNSNPIYVNGGYNSLDVLLKELSFASISEKINNGDPEILYKSVDENGLIQENTFCLEFIKPEDEITSTYLKTDNITRDTTYLQNFKDILGYKLTPTNRTTLKPISRQKGGYNPKFNDIIQFVDKNGDNIYENNRIYDGGDLGIIKNLYYNKVNTENASSLLRNSNNIYPYIGEIAIDRKDFFVFKSNFDPLYYTNNLTNIKNTTVSGLIEPKENKSFFGSKILSTPYNIRIDKINNNTIVEKNILNNTNIYYTDYNIIKNTTEVGFNNILNLKFYTDKLLIDYLIKDGISTDFYKYFNSMYINTKTMDDYIKDYIKENILDKYIIKGIVFWEKFYLKGDLYNSIELNLSDEEKLHKGYNKTKNFTVSYESDLVFNLNYNIPKDKKYSISFTIELEKK